MAKLKSRRLLGKEEQSDKVEEKVLVYCRRCMEKKRENHFHSAVDPNIDKNGLLSVCKDCVNELYENALLVTENNMEESIFKVCKSLNILFSSKVVDSLKLHLSKQESQGIKKEVFGLYKSHLGRHLSLNQGVSGTFTDVPSGFSKGDTIDEIKNETPEFKEYLKYFWGNGLGKEDYSYLETELARWKKTHSCSNAAEETLLREVCFTQLEIRKSRLEGNDPSTLIKRLQDLMKTANLASPVASSQAQDIFGVWIKDIESKTPAEWWEDNQIFKDVDGLMVYINDFIVRPIRNFIMSTRDFKISENDGIEMEDVDESFSDEDLKDGTEPEVD
jgi:hypothetical protein